jgi:hypothetical protein
VAVIALHQGSQCIQERLGAVERVHMQLRFVIGALVVRVNHYGRNMKAVAFRANATTLQYRHGISDYNGADVADAKDSKSSFNRRHRYDPVSGMRQNSISDGSQHPLCGDRKDCWTHIIIPSTNPGLYDLVIRSIVPEMGESK